MVLENSSEPNPDDAFYENPPPSDSDPYSSTSSTTPTSKYHIDRANFPKPIPLLGPLFGYDDKLFARVLQRKIEISSRTIERPVTSDEANAMAYYVSKNIAISSYGPVVGIGGGLWRAYNSAQEFRIPFFRPSPEFITANVHARGPGLVMLLHATRAGLYAAFGKFVADLVFGSYATSVSVVGELRDSRLKDLVQVMTRKSKERQNLPANRASSPESRVGGADNSDKSAAAQDDASPTGGMFADFYESMDTREEPRAAGTALGFNTKTLDGTGAAQPTAENGGRASRYGPPRNRSTSPAPEAESDAFDPFDDASTTSQSSASGSAWDRLRRGEKPAAAKPSTGWQGGAREQNSNQSAWAKQQSETQREQREGSSLGDGFAFSKTEEERAYAKEDAQKEFDARVEKERRGGDFNQGSGDQKRW